MATILALATIFSIFTCPGFYACAEDQSQSPAAPTAKIDLLLQDAISRGLIAGGVVLVGDRQGTLFQRAYGLTGGSADASPTTVATIYDIASLTKVVATTPAILKLAEEGRVSLVDPVSRWFPEFASRDKDELLVMNLLTHTSGLDDFPVSGPSPMAGLIDKAASQKIHGTIGSRFHYADINFILLGEMVRRATGFPLDRYASRNFFAPMGMSDTSFNPPPGKITRCATTIGPENELLTGTVQDPVARSLGGVAGHSGVFGTVGDLGRFCRMILNEGEVDGVRILSARAVQQMTAPYFSRGGNVVRGLGWDKSSPYSAPKGNGFSEVSFGHTGYSGSSIWIDPDNNLFVVLLTSRLDYKNKVDFRNLRGELSNLAGEIFSHGHGPGEGDGESAAAR